MTRPAAPGPDPTTAAGGLVAHLGVSTGSFTLDAAVAVAPGEVVALLGPNGAGKTTALRTLAGLRALDRGRITLDGTVLDDPAAATFVAAEHRRLGVVFQEHALFEHLDAVGNVAFGPRAQGRRRGDARRAALHWLEMVGLGEQAHLRPAALSGGQRQRVALARALAADPVALLLDEPLAALDVRTRLDVRRELRRHLDRIARPTVVVTHDPVDAHVLADRVIVIEQGRVTHDGALGALGAGAHTPYLAELAGVNLLEGRLVGATLHTPAGGQVQGTPAAAGGDPEPLVDGPGLATIHPRAVALYRHAPHGSPRNCWQVTVAALDERDNRVRVVLAGPVALVAEITAAARHELALNPGDEVWAVVKATEVALQPR